MKTMLAALALTLGTASVAYAQGSTTTIKGGVPATNAGTRIITGGPGQFTPQGSKPGVDGGSGGGNALGTVRVQPK